MTGLQISLVTYAILVVVGLGIAAVIWAIPRVIDFLMPKSNPDK